MRKRAITGSVFLAIAVLGKDAAVSLAMIAERRRRRTGARALQA